MSNTNIDNNSLAYTKWNCKCHIVFAPKYRRQIIYGKIKADVGVMLRKLCEYMGSRNHRSRSAQSSYTHADINSAKVSVSQIMGYFKGESS